MKIFIPIKNLSQRVPNKNFRLFGQKPLWFHTVSKLHEHEVFIDTDSPLLLEQVKQEYKLPNLHAYRRRDALCGHKVSVVNLIQDFVQSFDINEPVCQIHVTSPFLKTSTLKKAFQKMGDYDSVVSCTEHKTRFWRKEEYGYCPVNHNPFKLEQTQDLPSFYEENSCFYMFNPDVIMSGNRIGKNPFFFPIDRPESHDIDTERDWLECVKYLETAEIKK